MIVALIILAVGIVLIVLFIGMFNAVVRMHNEIDRAWANIDVVLKQRNDEVPNLVATVKGYAKHEKELLEQITKARAGVQRARTIGGKAKASEQLSGQLKTLFAVAENYPDLKANENFLKLQERITQIEDIIADRREFFNSTVALYNTRITQVPYVFFRKLLGAERHELFSATETDRSVPEVEV